MRVIVTGASSGLGAALKSQFEKEGHEVIGTTHRTSQGGLKHLDFINWMSIGRFTQGLEGKPIDCIINNAGTNDIRPFEELDGQFLHELMQINCIGPVLLVRQLLDNLKAGEGIVCNVISDASWRPMTNSLAYNISKAAMAMATRQMARELTKSAGLTVFGVNPGKMHSTDMSRYIDSKVRTTRGWTLKQAKEYYANASVNGKETDPEDVACLIADLVQSTGKKQQFLSGAVLDLVG